MKTTVRWLVTNKLTHCTSHSKPATSSPVPDTTSPGQAQTPCNVTSSTPIGPDSLIIRTHTSEHNSLTTRGDQAYKTISVRAAIKPKKLYDT